jgi:peptidoglycan/xylan/chitin deacetylase (PgdA/CDA1 family)
MKVLYNISRRRRGRLMTWFNKNKIIFIKLSSLTQFFNRRGMIFLLILIYLPGNIISGPLPSHSAWAQNDTNPIPDRETSDRPVQFEDGDPAEFADYLSEEEILYIDYRHTSQQAENQSAETTEGEMLQQSNGQMEPDGNVLPNPDKNVPAENFKATPVVIRGNPNAGKKVAITFDDGPYKDMTEKYISVLEAHGARATFFIVGKRAQAFPEPAQSLVERGFEIGGHSYGHSNIKKKTKQAMDDDFKRNTEAIENVTGVKVSLFRPPYGAYNNTLLQTAVEFSQQTVNWNVDPKDWSGIKSDEIVQRVLSNSENGSIILLHEGRHNTLQALPHIIEGLKERGYELVTVSELLTTSERSTAQERPSLAGEQHTTAEQDISIIEEQPITK